MSSYQEDVTGLTKKHFEFEAEITDPNTGQRNRFPMEIDTGCHLAVALPRNCEVFFTDHRTTFDLAGAGSKNSPAYNALIEKVGDIDVNYNTLAVMTLSNESKYGLIGIELLKSLGTEIFGEPDDKKMRLKGTHID